MLTNFDMRRLGRQFTPYSCETNYGGASRWASIHLATVRRVGSHGAENFTSHVPGAPARFLWCETDRIER